MQPVAWVFLLVCWVAQMSSVVFPVEALVVEVGTLLAAAAVAAIVVAAVGVLMGEEAVVGLSILESTKRVLRDTKLEMVSFRLCWCPSRALLLWLV